MCIDDQIGFFVVCYEYSLDSVYLVVENYVTLKSTICYIFFPFVIYTKNLNEKKYSILYNILSLDRKIFFSHHNNIQNRGGFSFLTQRKLYSMMFTKGR